MFVDEYLLAGYIANELSEEDRASVSKELLRDGALRAWLHRACEALAAVKEDTPRGPVMNLLSAVRSPQMSGSRKDRGSIPSSSLLRGTG